VQGKERRQSHFGLPWLILDVEVEQSSQTQTISVIACGFDSKVAKRRKEEIQSNFENLYLP
jgi:hypothetical protein